MPERKKPLTTARRISWAAAALAARTLRVALAWALLVIVLGLIVTRVGLARASDAGLNFSDELLRVGEHHVGGDVQGDVYTLSLNGQTFHSTNAGSTRPLGEVLDYFQEECRHRAGGLRDTFAHLEAALATLEPGAGTDGALVLREDAGDRGYVFCVAPDHALSLAEKVERVKAFGASGDLSLVGDVRYVAVRKSDVDQETFVVTAWTEGSFKLLDMFPEGREAPGEDFANVPRPDGARRLLSGSIAGAPFGINAYEVNADVPAVLANVDAKLTASGWHRQSGGPDIPDTGRFYAFGNALDLILSVDDEGRGVSRATYAVSYNTGHPSL